MDRRKQAYTVNQLAKMAGVSVRTLHHYDQIGLLKPQVRSKSGYRQYSEPDLMRLQQILFFRELDVPLAEIRLILEDPGFDQVKALMSHRQMLLKQTERLERLIQTVDKTIQRLTEEIMPLTDDELYEGFTPEQRERYPREARQMYDPKLVQESEQRVRRFSKEKWDAVKREGGEITLQIAELMDRDPNDPAVQAQIARHYAHLHHFYTPNTEMYRGLGEMYAAHPEFRAFYEKIKPGLADFMKDAIAAFCDIK